MIEYTVEVRDDGRKEWFLNGKIHREDGPAVEWPNGNKYWYINGQLHREDGPAIVRTDGSKEWYLNGERVTEKEFLKRNAPVKELTVAEISKELGYEVKIVK